jgi:glycosyltransferase involved in cell wall biosynthesis
MRNPIPASAEENTSGIHVVIAAYNEEQSIGDVTSQLRRRYPNVIVVDDGSNDDTSKRALEAGATVLRHVINRGQGAALQTGMTFALRRGARVLVTFDADGQHSVEDIPAMVAPILDGRAQITLGSRFIEDSSSIPFGRRVLLGAAVVFTRLTSGIRLTDSHNGFRAFSSEAAKRLDIRLDRMAHASEIIDQIRRSRLPYLEIPVHIRYTEYSMAKGQSSANAIKVVADYLLNKLME